VITDIVPDGVTYVGSSISGGTSNNDANPSTTGLTWTIASIAGGGSATLNFTASVDAGAAGTYGTITNFANFTSMDQTEESAGNNTGSVLITPQAFDLEVLKVASVSNPEEGETITYTVTVRNTTASATGTNIVITDVVPAGVTYVGSSISGGTSNNEANPDTSGLTWNIGSLAGGANSVLTFQAVVDNMAKTNFPTITNTASLTSVDQIDSTPGNDNGVAVITPRGIDLVLLKTVDVAAPEEGSTITYTVTLQNNSGQPATNILTTDVVPAGVTYVGSSISGGTSNNEANPSTTGLTWTVTSLAPAATATFTFQAVVDNMAKTNFPTITNTAVVTSFDQTEEVPANNTSSVAVTPVGLDIEIVKVVNNATPEEGETVTYTVTARNLSGQAATNIFVRDIVPSGITYTGSSITGGTSNNEANPSTTGLTWTVASLASGATATFTFQALVDNMAKTNFPTITNTALLVSIDQTEENAANNTNDAVITPVGIDVQVVKTVDVSDPVEGDPVVYTISVENLSGQPATNLVITDVVPAGVTYVPASITGGDFRNDANPETTGLTWTVSSLGAAATTVFTFTANVDGGAAGTYGTITNTASFTSMDQTEENAGNNAGMVDITPQAFDVAVAKTVNNATPEEGETITYTVTVTNTTVSATGTNIVITDVVPAGVTYVAASTTGGDSRTDADPAGSGLTWNVNSLGGGAVATFTFQAVVDNKAKADFVTVTNTASLTSVDQIDSVSANNSGAAVITPQSLDMSVVKTVNNDKPVEVEIITYTLAITNTSGQAATNLVIRDIVPAGVTFVSASMAGGDVRDESAPSTTGLVWTISSIAAATTVNLTFQAQVDIGAYTTYGTVTNTGSFVSMDQTEDTPGNNTESEDIEIQPIDIALAKTVDNASPNEDTIITYTVTVTNPSGSTATNLNIRDIVPNGATYVPGSITGADTRNEAAPDSTGLTWLINSLPGVAPNNVVTLTFQARVDNGARALGAVVNTGEFVSFDQTDINPANDTDTADFTARGLDLVMDKQVSDSAPNENTVVTYTLTVTNNGPSNATNVVVTDIVPSGVTYETGTMVGGDVRVEADPAGAGLQWTINNLASTASTVLTFNARTDLGAGGSTITNTADITSIDQTEEVPADNSDTADITVVANVDIEVLKVADRGAAEYEEGETVTYTITVTNFGPALASAIVIRDIVPADVIYTPGTMAGGDVIDESDPTVAGLSWTINSLTPIAPSNFVTLTFQGVVAPGANLNTPVVNNANLASVGQTETNAANDTGTASINIADDLDLAVVKTSSNVDPNIGEIFTYTVTVSNAGAAQASSVVIKDIIPNGLEYQLGTAVGADSVVEADPNGAGVDFGFTTINRGVTRTITFDVRAQDNSNLFNPIRNTAAVDSLVQNDVNAANDSSFVDVTVNPDLDIQVTKTVDINNPFELDVITYSLEIRNNGPAGASNVVITDLLTNSELTYVAASMTGGDVRNESTPYAGDGLSWTLNQLLRNQVVTLTFQAQPSSGTSGTTITNTGRLLSLDQPDINAANDNSSVDITVRNDADLEITQAVSNALPSETDTVVYTLTVTNNGPSVSRDIVINNLVPSGLTYTASSITGGTTSDAATPDSGTGLVWTIAEMQNTDVVTLTYAVTVDRGTAGNTINTTSDIVAFDSTESDPANNTSTIGVTVDNTLDLHIDFFVNNDEPEEREIITYTINVSNNGPKTRATNISLSQVVPSGITYVPGSITTGGVAVANDLDPAGAGLSWTIGLLDPVATVTLTFQAEVDPLTAGDTIVSNIINFAVDQVDTNATTDVLTESIQVKNIIDLQLIKTVSDPAPAVVLDDIIYTLTITNNGPSVGENIVITDVVPNLLDYQAGTMTGADVRNDASPQGSGLQWTINQINPGETVVMEFTVVAQIGAKDQTITNTASYTHTYTDNTPNDDLDVDITPVGKSDIQIQKTTDNSTPAVGETFKYILTLTNHGPIFLDNVTVVDVLPAGLTYASDNGGGNYNPVNGEWFISFLPNGASISLEISAVPNSGQGGNTIVNTVTEIRTTSIDTNNTPDDYSESVLIIDQTDLFINGSVSDGNPDEGDTETVTYIIENRGPQVVTNLNLRMVMPVGLTYVAASQTGGDSNSNTGADFDWFIGNMPVSTSRTLTFDVSVDAGTGGSTLSPTMNILSMDQTEDPVPADNNIVNLVVKNEADIFFTKTADQNIADEGDQIIFTITATNSGPARATNLSIDDILSVHFNLDSAVATSGAYSGSTWTIGDLDSGQTETLTLTVTIQPGAGGNNVENRLENQSQDQTDLDITPSDLTENIIIGESTDLQVNVTIIDDPGNDNLLEENQVFTYQIELNNLGPNRAENISLDFFNPAQVEFLSGGASASTGAYFFPTWTLPAVEVGATETLTISSRVRPDTFNQVVTATTANQNMDQADENGAVDDETETFTVDDKVDLHIAKTADVTAPQEGDEVVFIIRVENKGPANATAIEIEDIYPDASLDLEFSSATRGTFNPVTRIWNISSLIRNEVAILNLNSRVKVGAGGASITNTVQLNSMDQTDSNITPDDLSETLAVNGDVDLEIIKVVSDSAPVEGDQIVYTVTVNNNGPSAASNVQITDQIPAGLTFVSAVANSGAYAGDVWTIPVIPNGFIATLELTVDVDFGSGGNTIRNELTSITFDQDDPTGAVNDVLFVDITVPHETDLAFTKVADETTYSEGEAVRFTIEVTNNGPALAENVSLVDQLPTGLSYTIHTESPGTVYNQGSGLWTVGVVPVGETRQLVIDATVDAATNGTTLTNELVSITQDETDTNATADDINESIDIINDLDLVVTLEAANSNVNEQEDVTYTLTVLNLGPARATNVDLQTLLPAELSFVSAAVSDGTFNNGTLTWALPEINITESFSIEIVANAPEGSGGVSTTATSSIVALDQTETVPANNTNDAVVIINHENNLVFTKTVDDAAPKEGDTVTFTLTVENLGPAQSQNLQLTDNMPAGLTFASSNAASHGSFAAGIWTIGDLSMGETASIEVLATVDAGTNGQTLTNIISGITQDETDSDASGDDLEEPVTVDNQVDLLVTKIVDNAAPSEGDLVTFTLEVTNNGPIVITNLVLDDPMPTGLSFSSAGAPSHGSFVNPQWTIPTLNVAEVATLQISATVDAGTSGTTITNVITNVAMDQTDSTPAGDDLEEAVTVNSETDLVVTKTVDNAAPNELDSVSYTITVVNNGPARATNLTIEDPLPSGLTFVNANATRGAYSGNLWTIGNLDNAQTETLVLTASVNLGQSGNTIVNQITNVNLDQTDSNPAGDDLDESIIVGNDLDLNVALTVDRPAVDEGEDFIYTVTVSNSGPNQTSNLLINEIWPVGLELVSADQVSFDQATKIWNIDVLPIGGTQTLNITARAEPGTSAQTLTNTIGYSLDQSDSSAGDTLTVDVTVNSDLDLVVSNVVDNPRPNEGENVVFTLILDNQGPARATNISLDDVMPAGLTFVSAVAPAGSSFIYPTWTVAQIEAGEVVNMQVTASVDAGTSGTAITNTVTNITLDQTDTNASPDDLSEIIDVRNESDIFVTKTIDKQIVFGEDAKATFTIRVENKGPLDISGLEIDDDLDEKLNLLSATASQGTFTEPVWTVGSLAVGAVATLELEVSPKEEATNTTITNTVSRIFSDREDNNATPDVLSAKLSVLGTSSVSLRLSTNKTVVEVGDLMNVELEVESSLSSELDPLALFLKLSNGVSYVRGSTQIIRSGEDKTFGTQDDLSSNIDGEGIKPLAQTANLIIDGSTLEYLVDTGALEKYKFIFSVRVGPSAIGETISIDAFGEFKTIRVTSDLTTLVRLKKNEIYDMTSIIGKVFHDRDGDGYQDESIVRNLRLYGGTPLNNVVTDGVIEVDRGEGYSRLRGNLANGLRLGIVKGRSSRSDYSARTFVKVKIPVIEEISSDIELTTSEGTALTLRQDGRVIEKHSGLRRKGMSSQDLLVTKDYITIDDKKFLMISIVNRGVDEEGIPGVRIYGVNGLAHETDEFGRYNIPDIELPHNRGQNYILKVDTATLPKESKMTTENPRVQKITGGLFTKFNFGVQIPLSAEGKLYQSKKVSKILFNTSDKEIRQSEVEKIKLLQRELGGLPLNLKDGKVLVQGYTDFRGPAQKNRELSFERARTVLNKIKDVSAELSFSIEADNLNPHEQEEVTFVAQVKNTGLSDVENLLINMPLDQNLVLSGGIKESLGSYNGNRWLIGKLKGKSSARLEFRAKPKVFTSDEDFRLSLNTYIYEDLDKTKRIKSVEVHGRVKNEIDLEVVTTSEYAQVDERQIFKYKILVNNNGPEAATNLRLGILKDKNLDITSVEVSRGRLKGRKWSIGNLKFDEKAEAIFTVAVKEGSASKTLVTGVSTIYADQVDTNISPDKETLEIGVKNNTDFFIAANFDVSKAHESEHVHLTVKAINKGPIKVTNAEVSFSLDEGFRLVKVKPSLGRFKDGVWKIKSLDYDKSAQLKLTLAPEPRSGGSTLAARVFDVSIDQTDLDLTQDVYGDQIEVLNESDLILTKSLSNVRPEEGDEITITWKLKNTGPAVAQNIVLEDSLSKGLIKVGSYKSSKGRASGSRWSLVELLKGESAELKLNVKIAPGFGGFIIEDAVESFTHEQIDPLKNSRTKVKLKVLDETNLVFVKTFDKSLVNEGEIITTKIQIKNMGPAEANDIFIKDKISQELLGYDKLTVSDNSSWNQSNWLIPLLKVGESAKITYESRVAPGTGGSKVIDKVESLKMIEDYTLISKDSLSPSFNVRNETDVISKIQASQKKVDLGQEFALTYTLINNGPARAKNLSIVPPIDACFEVLSRKSDLGKIKGDKFNLQSLDVGQSAKMIVSVKAKYGCSKDEIVSAFGDLKMEQTELSDKGDVLTAVVKINDQTDHLVTVSSVNEQISEGEKFKFLISQANLGAAFINTSMISFETSENLEIIRAKSSKGEIKENTWTTRNLKHHDLEVLEIEARVKLHSSGSKSFLKIIKHKIDKRDLDQKEDILKKTFVVENKSDLSVEIAALKSEVKIPYLSYRYRLVNNGPAVAKNIKLKTLFDESSLKPISEEIPLKSKLRKSGRWDVAQLLPGESIDLVRSFEISNFTTAITPASYKDLSMNQEDSGLTKDKLDAAVKVRNIAKVKIKKSLSRKDIYEGETFEITIDVVNKGSQIARKIKINDKIDPTFYKTLSAVNTSRGKYENGIWDLGTLRSGERARLRVTVKFIKSISKDVYINDPIDKVSMEQDFWYDAKRMKHLKYKVRNIDRAISGEVPNE